MGYLSNANGIRLAIVRGWQDQRTINNPKLVNNTNHILFQKFLLLL